MEHQQYCRMLPQMIGVDIQQFGYDIEYSTTMSNNTIEVFDEPNVTTNDTYKLFVHSHEVSTSRPKFVLNGVTNTTTDQ